MNNDQPNGPQLPPPFPGAPAPQPTQLPPPLPGNGPTMSNANDNARQHTPTANDAANYVTLAAAKSRSDEEREAKKAEMRQRLEERQAKREEKKKLKAEKKAAKIEKAAAAQAEQADLAQTEDAASTAESETTTKTAKTKSKGINTKKPAKTWISESVWFTLLCCFPPTGIVAIILGTRVAKLNKQKRYVEAWQASATANQWLKITFFLGVAMQLAIVTCLMFYY